MPLYVNTNVASLEAQRNIAATQNKLELSFQRLSSGLRINNASDDAAGLAISESLKMQISGFATAERNTNNAISLSQVADGALGAMTSLIARMRDLAVQSSNGDLSNTDRAYLNTEFMALRSEINRLSSSTKFNNIELIGLTNQTIDFQVGIGTNAADRISVGLFACQTSDLGLNSTVCDTTSAAQSAITSLDAAMATINTRRENFGALVNRLQITLAHTQSMRTNLSAANSRIRDVDVAEETAALTRSQVIAQAGAAVLAQANQAPQVALSLLRGS